MYDLYASTLFHVHVLFKLKIILVYDMYIIEYYVYELFYQMNIFTSKLRKISELIIVCYYLG